LQVKRFSFPVACVAGGSAWQAVFRETKLKDLISAQCFHLQGFFLAAGKYWSLQGNEIYKEMARKNTKIKGNCKDFCNLYQLQI
jgi:hypothetical protein